MSRIQFEFANLCPDWPCNPEISPMGIFTTIGMMIFCSTLRFVYCCANDRYALCITPRLMDMFSELYDDNKDGNLTPDEKAVLFTSMIVQPESLMLKVSYKICHSEPLMDIFSHLYDDCDDGHLTIHCSFLI